MTLVENLINLKRYTNVMFFSWLIVFHAGVKPLSLVIMSGSGGGGGVRCYVVLGEEYMGREINPPQSICGCSNFLSTGVY